MLSQDELKRLRMRRNYVRQRINQYKAEGKDTSELTIQYATILKELRDNGVNVSVKSDIGITIESRPKEPKKKWDKSEQSFVINIAWTERIGKTNTDALDKIDAYLRSVLCNVSTGEDVYDDSSDDSFEPEHVIKYRFRTTQQVFMVIRDSVQFINECLYKPDCDVIEIYGKCLGPNH